MDNMHLIGDMPDDPRVREALRKVEEAGDGGMTEAITQPPPKGLERYGIKLRPSGLMHSAMLSRVMKKKANVPAEMQPFIYIFTLAAPIPEVWDALEVLDEKGFGSFMAIVQTWFEGSGIPHEVTAELVQAITETFELASKLVPTETATIDGQPEEVKKNALLGT